MASRSREGGGDRLTLLQQVLPRVTWRVAVRWSPLRQRVAHRCIAPQGGLWVPATCGRALRQRVLLGATWGLVDRWFLLQHRDVHYCITPLVG